MKISMTIFLLIFPLLAYSQGASEANLIFVIDEQLAVGSIANIKISDTEGNMFDALYYPGRLIFEKWNYNDRYSGTDSLTLSFDYYEDNKRGRQVYNYSLPFDKRWLKQDYLILKIYNLNKKVYKRKFDPLDYKRNYTFEIIYPGGQMLRLKNGKG